MSSPKSKIKKARPNIADSSLKIYVSNLEKLKKLFDTDSYTFLKDIPAVKEKLDNLSDNTKRNYYNAIIIYLMAVGDDTKKDKEILKEYNDMRDDLNKKYEDQQATGKISDKQKDNFVEMSEVENMIKEMEDEIKKGKLKKKDTLTGKEHNLVEAYVLFSIYTRLPMRNDVAGMEAITKREYNKLNDTDKKAKNYLVINKNNMFMVLNKYKTAKKYEENKIDIPKDLEKILRFWIRVNGMGILFKSSTGKELSRNALSQLLIKNTKKYMGKSISTTMLRKIYLSSKYGDVKKEMEKDAKVMGHDTDTAQKIYIKEKQEEE
tara:strand:- start:988 stop:1947 length:960 start_codon:yes stop_codon:yes gene_type:complete